MTTIEPYVIDIDEWRETPVPHRYVHATIPGTETRFSMYLPPADQYEGRFFQHITPVPDSEHLAQQRAPGPEDPIGFATSSGAYYLETNGGGQAAGIGDDPTVTAYGANAAAAECSRSIAAQMYGPHRPFGYAYGGSGGAYRTIGSMQNTDGVWDGVVPYVLGSPMAIPNMFTVRLRAMRVLRQALAGIADAVEPGGGDMYAGLDDDERSALEEITRMGFPPPAWFGFRTMGQHAFPVLFGGVKMVDPAYFTDFWTVPGHLGADGDASVWRDLIRHRTRVVGLVRASEAGALGLELESVPGQARGGVDHAFKHDGGDDPGDRIVAVRLVGVPDGHLESADMIVHTGDTAGSSLMIRAVVGDVVQFAAGSGASLARLRIGDEVEFDNRDLLAVETYHRHQVPGSEYPAWDQFRDASGAPCFPQRPLLLGPLFTAAAAGSVPTGEIKGKMILVESLWDREALPWQADWYRSRVQEQVGDAIDDRFRLWFVDHALHGDSEEQEDATQTVSYLGVLQQALRDLAAWVEQGNPPPASTSYVVADAQVVVPSAAEERLGIQPVVTLAVDGEVRAEVAVGAPVAFDAVIAVPPNTGTIVAVEWDFEGDASFAERSPVTGTETRMQVRMEHSFDRPGTYFPAVRAVAHRDGDRSTPFARIQNLGRMRVVVS